MRVLVVVEDDPDLALLIEITLSGDPRIEMFGGASTALAAIELAREGQPSLIVLDHFINGDIMGLEAAPMLKAVAPEAKILLFTSHPLEVEADREPAIDAFLRKSNITELLPTARRLLGLDPRTGAPTAPGSISGATTARGDATASRSVKA